MKITRHKKVNKCINFFCNNFGFRKPFQVLIDGTFCYGALKNKLNIQEQLPKYLGEVKLLTTPCVIVETEQLGQSAFGAMVIVKQFSVHQCQHTNKPVSGSECIQSMLGENNASRYIIATQDRDLQDIVRRVPGTPLLYLHDKTPHLEKPSPCTLKVANNKTQDRFGKVMNVSEGPQIKKKIKKGGPNPLSCKKKSRKTITNANTPKENATRRKRNRKKLAKHIKEHLAVA